MRKHPAAAPPSVGPLPAITALAFMTLVVVTLWFDSRDGTSPALAFADAPTAASSSPPLAPPPDKPRQPAPVPAAVAAFVTFAEASTEAEAPQVAGHTAEGVRRLADAIAAARNGSPLWVDRAKRLKAAADEMLRETDSVRRAETVKESFTLAAQWIADLSRGGGESAGLKQAAEAIRPDEPLRDQKQAVDHFFDQAAAALTPPESAGSA